MFCPNCGHKCAEGARYCNACGTKLSEPVGTDPAGTAPGGESASTPADAASASTATGPTPATDTAPIPAGTVPAGTASASQASASGQGPAPAPRASRTPLIAAIAAVLVIVLAGAGVAIAAPQLLPWNSQSNVQNVEDGDAGEPTGAVPASSADGGASASASTAASAPASDLAISVQQIDASAFPHVKVYLQVKDGNGDVPKGLDGSLFYLSRADANAKYVKQKVTQVSQLDEEEALRVDLVADVSGSMDGQPLVDAKSVMNGFIDSMQFDAGDTAELTSFSTGVRLEQEFTDDASALKQGVDNLYTQDMTSLYDALYTAVERVAAQSGARCVIAFTDGDDNNSSVAIEQVEEAATRYRIPIFIIGVGDADYTSVSQLASATGGMYFNVGDTISMADIYKKIYRTEKDLYLLEYDDESGASASDEADIRVGYKGSDFTGECDYSYTPNILNSADGKGVYTTGPEATVQGYLKNWAPAITNSDYSQIAPYIEDGSRLHRLQKDYVKNAISERLDSYELTDTSYSDDSHCTVSTRETFYVQTRKQPLQLLTQKVRYTLELVGDDWLMTDILIQDVVSINQ